MITSPKFSNTWIFVYFGEWMLQIRKASWFQVFDYASWVFCLSFGFQISALHSPACIALLCHFLFMLIAFNLLSCIMHTACNSCLTKNSWTIFILLNTGDKLLQNTASQQLREYNLGIRKEKVRQLSWVTIFSIYTNV